MVALTILEKIYIYIPYAIDLCEMYCNHIILWNKFSRYPNRHITNNSDFFVSKYRIKSECKNNDHSCISIINLCFVIFQYPRKF